MWVGGGGGVRCSVYVLSTRGGRTVSREFWERMLIVAECADTANKFCIDLCTQSSGYSALVVCIELIPRVLKLLGCY